MALRALRNIEAQGGAEALGAAAAVRLLTDSTVQLRIDYGDEPAQRVEVETSSDAGHPDHDRVAALVARFGLDKLKPPVPLGDLGPDD